MAKRDSKPLTSKQVKAAKLAAKRKGFMPFVHPRGKRYLVITKKGKKVLRWEDQI